MSSDSSEFNGVTPINDNPHMRYSMQHQLDMLTSGVSFDYTTLQLHDALRITCDTGSATFEAADADHVGRKLGFVATQNQIDGFDIGQKYYFNGAQINGTSIKPNVIKPFLDFETITLYHDELPLEYAAAIRPKQLDFLLRMQWLRQTPIGLEQQFARPHYIKSVQTVAVRTDGATDFTRIF